MANERLIDIIKDISEEEATDFLFWLVTDYAKRYTDSRLAVIEWLKRNGGACADCQEWSCDGCLFQRSKRR